MKGARHQSGIVKRQYIVLLNKVRDEHSFDCLLDSDLPMRSFPLALQRRRINKQTQDSFQLEQRSMQ